MHIVMRMVSYLAFGVGFCFGLLILFLSVWAGLFVLLCSLCFLPQVRDRVQEKLQKPVLFRHAVALNSVSFLVAMIAIVSHSPTRPRADIVAQPHQLSPQQKEARAAKAREEQKKVQDQYAKAFALQGQGQKKEALAAYQKVVSLQADYKDTEKRIDQLKHHFKVEAEKAARAQAQAKAARLKAQNEKWENALVAYQKILAPIELVENIRYTIVGWLRTQSLG